MGIKISLRKVMPLAFLALASAACAPGASPDTAADAAALRTFIDRATEINNAMDAAAWADLFAEGAIFMPEGEPEISGSNELQASAQRWFDEFTPNITIDPVEIEVLGDWAFIRTRITGSLTRKTGEQVPIDMKEIAIYRRQPDASWKLWRLIGNGNFRS